MRRPPDRRPDATGPTQTDAGWDLSEHAIVQRLARHRQRTAHDSARCVTCRPPRGRWPAPWVAQYDPWAQRIDHDGYYFGRAA
jgi:hypothetical protein